MNVTEATAPCLGLRFNGEPNGKEHRKLYGSWFIRVDTVEILLNFMIQKFHVQIWYRLSQLDLNMVLVIIQAPTSLPSVKSKACTTRVEYCYTDRDSHIKVRL